ncbi:hypothetical protein [Methyloprofundus sp.]|uniref:hypothetical protein n=1 Tax=Methyloprofundus sp. TaxID=2020875 RepID=UPI003D0A0769
MISDGVKLLVLEMPYSMITEIIRAVIKDSNYNALLVFTDNELTPSPEGEDWDEGIINT